MTQTSTKALRKNFLHYNVLSINIIYKFKDCFKLLVNVLIFIIQMYIYIFFNQNIKKCQLNKFTLT